MLARRKLKPSAFSIGKNGKTTVRFRGNKSPDDGFSKQRMANSLRANRNRLTSAQKRKLAALAQEGY